MDDRITERIARQRHDTPAGFDARMDARVQQVMQRPARRAPRLRLAVALCLLLAGGAVALQYTGVLQFRVHYMREDYYFMLPAAQELVHRLDAEAPFDGGTLTLKEALYDGRWLHVLYSVTDHSAARPFTAQEKQDIENGDMQAFYALLNAADAYPSTETNGTLLIDGIPVSIYGLSATAGEQPGEYLFLCDSLLEQSDGAACLRLEGSITLSLSLVNRHGAQVQQAQAALNVGDAAARYALPLPAPVVLDGARLDFTDVFASPASVVLAYTITSDAPVAQPDDEELLAFPPVVPVNAQGHPEGTGRDSQSRLIILPDGHAQRQHLLSYTPGDLSQPLFLQLPDGKVISVLSAQ